MSTEERFREVRAADLRAIHRLTGSLMEAGDLMTLGHELIKGSIKILPADFMLWNLWTLQMDELLAMESNCDEYCTVLGQYSDTLATTIQHHPVIAAGHLESAKIRPQRISDYTSNRSFIMNPLYQEVYRHVDSRHQIAYDAIRLEDCQVILSWNRRKDDFTDREIQLLHILGLQVAALSRRLEDRQHLQCTWKELADALDLPVSTVDPPPLGPKDGYILSSLVKGIPRVEIAATIGWRRDTLDRHLAVLRERLGFENMSQLQQTLADLRPSVLSDGTHKKRGST